MQISGMSCPIRNWISANGVHTHQIGYHTCRIRNDKWLADKILWSSSISWSFPASPLICLFLILNSTITWVHNVKSSLTICQWHDHQLTASTAYTECSIYGVHHIPNTANTASSIHVVQQMPSKAYTECKIHRIEYQPEINCLRLQASLSSVHLWHTS